MGVLGRGGLHEATRCNTGVPQRRGGGGGAIVFIMLHRLKVNN